MFLKKFFLSTLYATLYAFFCLFAIVFVVATVSCSTTGFSAQKNISRNIDGRGVLSAAELVSFFMTNTSGVDKAKVQRLANYYVSEAFAEGINSDVAFAQMCLETGYLHFGNLVTPDMNNFCGLGAIDAAHPGERFATEQLGVRAHIQHLHAYGTTRALKNECIDNRYRYVNPRGKAPTIFELAGTWAADRQYGTKLDAILSKMETTIRN